MDLPQASFAFLHLHFYIYISTFTYLHLNFYIYYISTFIYPYIHVCSYKYTILTPLAFHINEVQASVMYTNVDLCRVYSVVLSCNPRHTCKLTESSALYQH
jgi:hypothetical protein